MSSSPSTILGVELQADGENNLVWGDKLNVVVGLLEEATKSVLSVDCTAVAAVNLTATNFVSNQARRAGWKFTGTPSGNVIAVAPSKPQFALVVNALGGGASVTVKTSAGGGVTVANGVTALIWCDGTNYYDTGFGATAGATAALFQATSNTNNVAIAGSGSKTLTLNETGRAFIPSITTVRYVDAANANNYMDILVTAYSGTTLTGTVTGSGGSGTPASWVIGFTGTNTFVTTTVTNGGGDIVLAQLCA